MDARLADRRLFWTADKSQLVEEGDARAATLAFGEGEELPEGIRLPGEKAQAPAPNKAQEPSRNKSRVTEGASPEKPATGAFNGPDSSDEGAGDPTPEDSCAHCGKTAENFASEANFQKHLEKFAG